MNKIYLVFCFLFLCSTSSFSGDADLSFREKDGLNNVKKFLKEEFDLSYSDKIEVVFKTSGQYVIGEDARDIFVIGINDKNNVNQKYVLVADNYPTKSRSDLKKQDLEKFDILNSNIIPCDTCSNITKENSSFKLSTFASSDPKNPDMLVINSIIKINNTTTLIDYQFIYYPEYKKFLLINKKIQNAQVGCEIKATTTEIDYTTQFGSKKEFECDANGRLKTSPSSDIIFQVGGKIYSIEELTGFSF